jgi:hypothetical protein
MKGCFVIIEDFDIECMLKNEQSFEIEICLFIAKIHYFSGIQSQT